MAIHWLNWPVAPQVKACFTDRVMGTSEPPFNAFNLAHHVGDKPEHVDANRRVLQEMTGIDACWVSQVHGTHVVRATPKSLGNEADAVFAAAGDRLAAVVMTADCLPVFFASDNGQEVAVAHAGWRGLANGVLEKTLDQFTVSTDQIQCYLGPAIGPDCFEVGQDVVDAFEAVQTATVVLFLNQAANSLRIFINLRETVSTVLVCHVSVAARSAPTLRLTSIFPIDAKAKPAVWPV